MTAPVQGKGREALEKLKAAHFKIGPTKKLYGVLHERCDECGQEWPCDVARLIEALEEALRRLSCCHTCDHEDDGSPVFHVLSKLSEVR